MDGEGTGTTAARTRQRWLAGWQGLSGNLRGALWILLSTLLFSVMAAAVKYAGQRLPSVEIVTFRALAQIVILGPLVLRGGFDGVRTKRPGLHLLRAVMAVGAINFTFYALTHMPLADATAISFSRSLFLTLMAIVFLGETVGRHRWTALAVGFVGVVMILRPGLAGFEPAALVALAAAALVAGLAITVRVLSRTEPNVLIMIFPATMTLLVTAPMAAAVWLTPTLEEVAVLVVMGVVGVAAQGALVQAFRVGEASALAPIGFVRLVFAVIMGVVLFAEVPDLITVAGSLVIVAGTLYTMHRENLKKRALATARPTQELG
ncbi:MAG: DMT family transporter [Hyphomicrobiales bacterium]|nr:DMT family transporter [Hyphomicrobiales bacterium]MCP5372510.1 DMT family transporter [Hyphomicrobiales bacterium]